MGQELLLFIIGLLVFFALASRSGGEKKGKPEVTVVVNKDGESKPLGALDIILVAIVVIIVLMYLSGR